MPDKIKSFREHNKQRRKEITSKRWVKTSKAYRKANPLCVSCFSKGIYKVVECVDHITPRSEAPELIYDKNNLQSLCNKCHAIKTLEEGR